MGRPALLGRAPKQCRSRYLQQLVPGIKTGEWSPEEEEVLVDGHRQFGNQWTLIASMLPGRTETSVKNHYNCTARRYGSSCTTSCSQLLPTYCSASLPQAPCTLLDHPLYIVAHVQLADLTRALLMLLAGKCPVT
jgi:hypothetical protein